MKTYRPTWIEIDISALRHNLKQVRKLIPAKTKVLVTVKADAYGHGLIPISQQLVKNKVDYLGVASIDEALVIKNAKIKTPILILGTILPSQADIVVKNNFIQAVSTYRLALNLNKAARKQSKRFKIHVKIDTGMARQGVWQQEAVDFIKKIKKLEYLKLEGIFTHFPCADTDKKFTNKQIRDFNIVLGQLNKIGIKIPLRHCANSMAVIDYKNSYFNLVRPGLMVYGLQPKKNIRIKLKPVLSLKSKIVLLKKTAKATGISYGHSFYTKKATTIGIVPLGYGDGYPRILSNKSKVLIKARFANVIGCVCMDQLIVDVSMIKNIKVGESVVLIGKQKGKTVSAENLAALAQTIPYEIVCGFNNRIPRFYI